MRKIVPVNPSTKRKKPYPILLIEPDTAYADQIVRSFSRRKKTFKLTCARTLKEAREVLGTTTPALIFSALELPDGRGIDILPKKDGHATLPLVILADHGDQKDALALLKSGALDYVVKSDTSLQGLPFIAERTLAGWDNLVKRVAAEKAAVETHEQFQVLVENIPAGVAYYDLKGNTLFYNKAAAEAMGGRPEDFVGKSIYELFDRPLADTIFQRIQATKRAPEKSEVYEDRVTLPTGVKWFLSLYSPVRNQRGAITGVQIISTDVTGSKQAEEEAAQFRKRLTDILDFLPDATFAIDAEGRVIAWNRAIEAMTGVPAEQIVGRGDYEYSIPFYGERRPILIDLVLKSRDDIEQKYLYIQRDGEKITSETFIPDIFGGRGAHLWGTASPLYDMHGNLAGAVEVIRDISDRKESERALLRSEKLLKQTQQMTHIGGWEYDIPSQTITWTDEVYRIYEVPDEFDPNNIQDDLAFYSPEDRAILEDAFRRAVEEGIPYDLELKFVSGKGVKKWVKTIAQAECVDGNPVRLFGYIIDITERKEKEIRIKSLLESVRNEKERLMALLNSITDEVWFADLDHRFILANPRAKEEFQLGESDTPIVDELARSLEVLRPDGTPRPVEDAPPLRALSGEVIRNMEEIIRTPMTGELRYRQVSSTPVRDSSGAIIGSVSVVRDITDLKRAEEAIRESNERFNIVSKATNDTVWDWDLITGRQWWNDGIQSVFGYRPEEIEPTVASWYTRIHPDDRERVIGSIHAAIDKGESAWMEEYLFRKSDGSYAYVFDRGFVIRDQEGRAIRMVGAMQDLTERMRMVDALRESEARFRHLFSHMSAGVAIYRAVQNGEDFIFIEVNPAVERIEKVRREDTIGRSVLEVFPGIKEFGLFDVFQRVWRTGIPEHHPISEYRDGRISGWRENTVFRLPSGEVVSIYEDVTDRKQAEEAIRLSEVQYRTLAEGIPDIITRFDREHRHTYINHAIERVTGKPAESFLGRTNQDLGMPDELCRLWDEKLDQVFEKGSAVTFEFAYPLGENLQFFESRIIPERSHSGEVLSVISVARDITDEKRAEKGRMESEARLDSAMEIGSLAWWEMELPEGTVRFGPRKAAMLGYSPGQFRHYTDFTALLHPDDIEPAMQAMRGHLEGQKARYEVDYRLRTATGDYHWFRDVGGITNRHPDGSPATVTGIVIDITAAKEAEESLRRSELFLKQTEELTQVGGWEYDAATRRFRWTDEMYRIYGVPRDFDPSDISHNLSFYSPEDRVVIESAFRRAIEEGAPYDIELRFRSADGKDKWVRTTAQVERRDGIISRIYGNLMGITERKTAENALRESELWFREIFNKANDGIELIGVTEDGLPGRFIDVNDIACSMLGYQREELLRMSPFDVNTDWYDQPLEKIISELGTRGHATFQTEHRKKDGTVFPVEINSHRIALGGKDYFISVVRDITERKKTHTALMQSEERYRTLVEEIPDLVIVQRKGELLYVNPAITQLMGTTPDQLLHSNILTYIAPESRDDVKTAMERRERGDKVDPYVVRLLLPDRTERWVEVRGSRILFDGQPAILNILSNITDRKHAEEALAESETRFRALIQNSSDIIRVLGRDRRIIYESPSAGRLLGYPPGSMIGKDPMEFVHPVDRERVTRDLGEVFEKTNPGIPTEFRIRKADGEYLWVDTIGVNLLGVPGVDGIVVTTRVIQQRKEAEEALRESEQRYEEVIANSPDSIFVVEVTGEARFRILYMNPVSEEHMGVSNASASGKYLEELFSPEVSGHLSAMYRKCLDAGAALRYEESQNHPEGKRYYSTTLVPLKVAGGKIARIIGISHDITSRRLMESEIRSLNTVLEQRVIERTRELESANDALVAEIGQREAAEERLRASLEEKLTLLREVHHRVKNNLQIIVSLLNLQSRYITDESTLAAIRESQNRVRAMALVHEKLYQTETLSQINLDDYLKYLGKSLFQFYGANTRGITFSVDTGDVHVDINTAIPFALIMNELISNSLKYAFPDKRRGAVSISVRRDDHALHVEYRDTGVGIPEDLDWQNTKSLGLRLVHSLVSQLNGSIALDRREGTAFSMVLHEKE